MDPFVAQHFVGGDPPDKRDTAAVQIVPIIFVPGVMGSRLFIKSGNNWDPDSDSAMGAWAGVNLMAKLRDLSVDQRPSVDVIRSLPKSAKIDLSASQEIQGIAQGLKIAVNDLYAQRGWGGVAWGFYGTILPALETAFNFGNRFMSVVPNPVHAFGYDFRRSNVDSGDSLVAFIGEVIASHPGAEKVILVTHSMGGLVARAAMVRNPSVIAVIKGVVHGAQPANGAVVAYRRFLSGATAALDGSGAKEIALEVILGTDPTEYTILLSHLPGPMELLPNQLYQAFKGGDPWLKTSPQVDIAGGIFATYALPNRPGIMLSNSSPGTNVFLNIAGTNGVLGSRLASAAAFHVALASAGHPNTHVLLSDGVKTDAQVDSTPATSINFLQTKSGDGTVPASSGRCPNIPAIKSTQSFNGLLHADVYQDNGFNKATINRVRLILSTP